MVNVEKTNQTCLWCGKNTSGNISREHIFPEAIGGKEKLSAESVCGKCNHDLGFLDKALKREHPSMLDAFQVDKNIKGKTRNKQDKVRKEKERSIISGEYEASSTIITRDNDGNICFTNSNFVVTAEYFVRSLHKCVANILCHEYGSEYVRKKYLQLLDFVNKGGDVRPWSYAVSYPNRFSRPLISKPEVVGRCSIKIANKVHEIISFIHTSGIWIVGSSPSLLKPNLIEEICDSILESQKEHPLPEWFGSTWKSGRTHFGELNFLWVVKEIMGKPNDDFLYLLTTCKTCGQTNPTGISLPRDRIYQGNRKIQTRYPENTWNNYTKNDLLKLGFRLEKWEEENLKKYMYQGISIPIENAVGKMNIIDCKCQCISCGNIIKFSASGCFI